MAASWSSGWKVFSQDDWNQAYNEINEMEDNFSHFGSIVVKFWVHIDKDEQLKRFKAREDNPHKRWKLHEEDWRNREKWDLYEEAAQEMFLRTHSAKSSLDDHRRKLQAACKDQGPRCRNCRH